MFIRGIIKRNNIKQCLLKQYHLLVRIFTRGLRDEKIEILRVKMRNDSIIG